MKKSKAILMALCAMLLVVASVMGTLAYLTDSKTVTNTFTVGNVHIKLDEAPVGENGKKIDGNRVAANEYHLLPGHEYDKDPMVTVLANSDKSFVRMLVTVTFATPLDKNWVGTKLDGIFTGYQIDKWIRNGDPSVTYTSDGTAIKSIAYEYRYYTAVADKIDADKHVDNPLEPLFTNIVVPESYSNDDIAALNGMEIKIVAQAIQADGFATADAAWEKFSA